MRLPEEKCYVHNEIAGLPMGGTYMENAIDINVDPGMAQHEQLVAVYAECHWPDPLDAYKHVENPGIFGFPSGARICDYFPTYGPLRETQRHGVGWLATLGNDYINRVLLRIFKSKKISGSDKHMYVWEISIYNYPKNKVVFEVYWVE